MKLLALAIINSFGKKKISLKKYVIRKNPPAIMTPEQYNNQNKNS